MLAGQAVSMMPVCLLILLFTKKIDKEELLCGQAKDGICPFIVGYSAYPLRPWLMEPFPHSGSLTAQQKLYNYRMCRGRVVVNPRAHAQRELL